MSLSTTRPSTSKPRGVCRYYTQPRGCFAADKCKFLHGEPPSEAKPDDPPMLTPYDKAKRCVFYAQGFCKRGDSCWFLHVSDRKSGYNVRITDEDEELCSICFEKPVTFGLLAGCSHIFCITCINQWRDPKNKPGGVLESGNTKKCPMCRASTNFITPSSKFWKAGTKEKDRTIKAYKESMSRVSCRWFQRSLQKNQDKPFCPYGKDCFYQHINADGTPHIFKEGVDAGMRKSRRRHGRAMIDDFNIVSLSLDFADFLLDRQLPTRLRAGLGRFDTNLEDGERRLDRLTRQRVDETNDGMADGTDRQEMDRLEVLADQMLASIQILQMNAQEESGRNGAETPPPALVAVEQNGGPFGDIPSDMPSLQFRPYDWRGNVDDGYESVDSMPDLQSVSDSSDDEVEELSDEDSDEDEDFSTGAMRLGDVLTAAHVLEHIQSTEQFSDVGHRVERAEEPVEREGEDQDVESESDTPALETTTEEAHLEPPFITDGRGRVVWTSPAEGDKTSRPAEEETGEPASRPEAATGSGGLLGWFNHCCGRTIL